MHTTDAEKPIMLGEHNTVYEGLKLAELNMKKKKKKKM